MLANDVDLYLPGGNEGGLRAPDFGGAYQVTGVRFSDGLFRLNLQYCGDDEHKRLGRRPCLWPQR